MKKVNKLEVGLSAVHVDGWDSRCEVFVSDKIRERLDKNRGQFELLNAKSVECYLVKAPDDTPLVFVGLVPLTLVGGEAYIWMIPFKGLKARYLRDMKRLFETLTEKFTKLVAQVFYCEMQEERFVKYFGFVPTRKTNGLTVYERKK